MNARRLATAAILLFIGVALGRASGQAADDKKKSSSESLAVECAKAELKLAEMNYAWAQGMNQRIPGTLIAGMIQEFIEDVEMAKVHVAIAEKVPNGDPYLATLERMKLAFNSADEPAEKAADTHQKAPNIVTKEDVERTRQMAILADLQLQRGMALKDATPEAQLAWQLEMLGKDIDHIRLYTYLLGQNRVGQFAPGSF